MQSPAPFLGALGITLSDEVDDQIPAQIDDSSWSRVGYDLFFFGLPENKRRFDEDPTRYCDTFTDPVTQVRFRPGDRPLVRDHDGVRWIFVSDATRTRFDSTPESFLRPDYKMKPAASGAPCR